MGWGGGLGCEHHARGVNPAVTLGSLYDMVARCDGGRKVLSVPTHNAVRVQIGAHAKRESARAVYLSWHAADEGGEALIHIVGYLWM